MTLSTSLNRVVFTIRFVFRDASLKRRTHRDGVDVFMGTVEVYQAARIASRLL